MLSVPVIAIGVFVALLFAGIRVLQEYERGVVFRLGRYAGVKQAGLTWIIPGVDRLVKISLREIVMDVPSQEVITRDNVSVKVNAVLYFRVLHPEKSVISVENYLYGTSQLAQTTLRSVCGQAQLDELLSERDRLNEKLQEIIDTSTEPWGIKVTTVEIKDVEIPEAMQRAMARQAEAERERRAKVINAAGARQERFDQVHRQGEDDRCPLVVADLQQRLGKRVAALLKARRLAGHGNDDLQHRIIPRCRWRGARARNRPR